MTPSFRLRVETFQYYGSFSKYTPTGKRAFSAPPYGTGPCAPFPAFKRSKSETNVDFEFVRPLVDRNGIVTFGRQSVSVNDIAGGE